MSALPGRAPGADDEAAVRRCLEVARRTPPGDVPVGALVLGPDGREVAAATNRRESDGDPLAHAEVLALRAAARELGDGWRLEDCTLVVTLEPCTMCAGAAVAARVGRIVFGAWEPRTGACGSLWDVVRDRRLMHRPEVRGGVCEPECAELVEGFFRERRRAPTPRVGDERAETRPSSREENPMGVGDKFENKAEELGGRAKESAGAATGNEDLKAQGQADQGEATVKQGAEKLKDKANEAANKLTGNN